MSEFNLSAWALRNRSVIAFFMIIAVAAGLASYFRLGRSEDPSFIHQDHGRAGRLARRVG
jgi:multidrug efflux pump subunit AcrB